MVDRVGGSRRKSRYKFKKPYRMRGKVGLSRFFQVFNVGDRVALCAEPSIHKGFYHARFHGLAGRVVGKKRTCLEVEVSNCGLKKVIVVHPVHLKRLS